MSNVLTFYNEHRVHYMFHGGRRFYCYTRRFGVIDFTGFNDCHLRSFLLVLLLVGSPIGQDDSRYNFSRENSRHVDHLLVWSCKTRMHRPPFGIVRSDGGHVDHLFVVL